MKRSRLVLALASAAVITGCGSTVATTQGVAPTGGQGLTVPTAAAARNGTTVTTPTGANGSAGSASGNLTTATGPVATTSLTAPAPAGSSGSATQPTAINPKLPPIQIGTYYLQGGGAALAAAGFAGLVIPDNKPLFDAMVKYLNAHGGLGGRRIVPVEFRYNSNGDPHAQDAAACADFTQDHHVYLVVGGISSGAGDLPACLIQHGVPLIGANLGGDEQYFAQNHQFIYEPGQANFTLGLSTLVNNLAAQSFFSGPATKVGVVQYEGPTYDRAVDDGLTAALAQHGIKLTDRIHVTSSTDNSIIARDSASAVLKFSSEGINRVFFMAPGGAVATYFMEAASTQHYHPRYGFMSINGIVSLTGSGSAEPQDQMVGSQGVSWETNADGLTKAPTRSAKLCLAILKAAGIDTTNTETDASYLETCQHFFLFKAAGDAAGLTLNRDTFISAVEHLGTSFESTNTWGGATRFGVNDHHGVAAFRPFVYHQDCKCFVVNGPAQPVGSS